jgi:soluble lytic murein transglycosylase-like protein
VISLLILAGLGILAYALLGSPSGANPLVTAEQYASDLEASMSGWQNVNQGPVWVPVINQTEASLSIPTNLLARMAFEESSFLPAVIDGTQASSAGALGILQLMPQYFTTVQVAIPFSSADTSAQITQAGEQLVSLYQQFGDWGVAVAAYNAGAGTMQAVLAGTEALPTETSNYVAAVLSDVPVQTQLTV